MHVWIAWDKSAVRPWCEVWLVEPDWAPRAKRWWVRKGKSIFFDHAASALRHVGFSELPEVGSNDLYEYDLSGKKPRLVDIWEPPS